MTGIVEGRLWLDWEYSANLHQRSTIERLAQSYIENLKALLALARSAASLATGY
jgi:hypothetical protein